MSFKDLHKRVLDALRRAAAGTVSTREPGTETAAWEPSGSANRDTVRPIRRSRRFIFKHRFLIVPAAGSDEPPGAD